LAALFYIRLISLTAGAIVYLFLLALILGHRRPRKFERLLFFLILSLFLFYSGGLLKTNSSIEYASPPEITRLFWEALIALGAAFLPALLVHTHIQYYRLLRPNFLPRWCERLVWLLYVFPLLNVAVMPRVLLGLWPPSVEGFLVWLAPNDAFLLISSLLVVLVIETGIIRASRSGPERTFFLWLCAICAASFILLTLYEGFATLAPIRGDGITTAILIGAILPGLLLIYFSLRHNFLEFGAQRNLVYALSAMFLALLYLALVHRVSGWLAPVFPPEATASVLLFILIFLFEPLERVIGPVLHRRLSERIDHVQRLTSQIQQEARQGSIAELVALAERRIREEFGLAAVRISVPLDAAAQPLEIPGGLGHAVRLPLMKDKQEIGLLEAATTGAYITGETSAALEFLAEQLPAMFDLCRLIEEKLRLERELAERERLALLGQMAASVSHNLRNPLSSMKTILQVQLEKADLPFDIRHDCALVVGEIDRMSAKLTQLLKFAKPSVNGQRIGAVALAKQTAALFSRDAERRNVRLEFDCPAQEVWLLASEEALSEVLSNLIINAIEAQPNGGRVRVGLTQTPENLEIRVEDDGSGISQEVRSKIFQPFFTTKATGTGLGLSIVARRVAEMGGEVLCESPLKQGKGTRFTVRLPATIGKETTNDAVDSDRR
jgi:signal transduction histidine kinase